MKGAHQKHNLLSDLISLSISNSLWRKLQFEYADQGAITGPIFGAKIWTNQGIYQQFCQTDHICAAPPHWGRMDAGG
jgi:hypothetical protein